MAMGTPVVTTRGACRALMVEPDTHLLVGDSVRALGLAILSLLDDEEQRQRLGKAGRRYVEAHHSWNCITARLESVYQEAIDESGLRKGR